MPRLKSHTPARRSQPESWLLYTGGGSPAGADPVREAVAVEVNGAEEVSGAAEEVTEAVAEVSEAATEVTESVAMEVNEEVSVFEKEFSGAVTEQVNGVGTTKSVCGTNGDAAVTSAHTTLSDCVDSQCDSTPDSRTASDEYTAIAAQLAQFDFYVRVEHWPPEADAAEQHGYIATGRVFNVDLVTPLPTLPCQSPFWLYISRPQHKCAVYFETRSRLAAPVSGGGRGVKSRRVVASCSCHEAVLMADYELLAHAAAVPTMVGFCVRRYCSAQGRLTVEWLISHRTVYRLDHPSDMPRKSSDDFRRVMAAICQLQDDTSDRECSRTDDTCTNIDDVYTYLKQLRESSACVDDGQQCDDTPDPQHRQLRPTLRPYQRRAVRWMLQREMRPSRPRHPAALHPLYRQVTLNGCAYYYNVYGGWFSAERPHCDPGCAAGATGGILANEMGLGKTVEVLALLLCHRRPQLAAPAQPVDSVDFDEMSIDESPSAARRCRKRRSRSSSSSEEEETDGEREGEATGSSVDSDQRSHDNRAAVQQQQQQQQQLSNYVSDSGDDDCVYVASRLSRAERLQQRHHNKMAAEMATAAVTDDRTAKSAVTSQSTVDICSAPLAKSVANATESSLLVDPVSGARAAKQSWHTATALETDATTLSDRVEPSDLYAETIDEVIVRVCYNGTPPRSYRPGVGLVRGRARPVAKSTNTNSSTRSSSAAVSWSRRCAQLTYEHALAEYSCSARARAAATAAAAAGGIRLEDRTGAERADFSCLCGEWRQRRRGRRDGEDALVRCGMCGRCQHAHCVGYDLGNRQRRRRGGAYYCPQCWRRREPLQSGATLIVTPLAIRDQWVAEIEKHVRVDQPGAGAADTAAEPAARAESSAPSSSSAVTASEWHTGLRVLVYNGVHGNRYLQPQTLASYDVVVTTYSVLQKELNYVAVGRDSAGDVNDQQQQGQGLRKRRGRRYMAPTTPLLCVQWWRVCLDEAQMVECTTTRTADMALQLASVHRWCVTGTPTSRSLDDLYGLLLFLGADPASRRQWWLRCYYQPYLAGNPQPLRHLLAEWLWRSCKQDVAGEICLPRQTEHCSWLSFTPIESYYYRWQCGRLTRSVLQRYGRLNRPASQLHLADVDRATVETVLGSLACLRRACCHPQHIQQQQQQQQRGRGRGRVRWRRHQLPWNTGRDTGFTVAAAAAAAAANGDGDDDDGGGGGGGGGGGSGEGAWLPALTMDRLLEQMVGRTTAAAEEAHRQRCAAACGLAALHVASGQLPEAVQLYRHVLRESEQLAAASAIGTDLLQRLHAAHNLDEVLCLAASSASASCTIPTTAPSSASSSISVSTTTTTCSSSITTTHSTSSTDSCSVTTNSTTAAAAAGVGRTLRDSQLPALCNQLRTEYMQRHELAVTEVHRHWTTVAEQIQCAEMAAGSAGASSFASATVTTASAAAAAAAAADTSGNTCEIGVGAGSDDDSDVTIARSGCGGGDMTEWLGEVMTGYEQRRRSTGGDCGAGTASSVPLVARVKDELARLSVASESSSKGAHLATTKRARSLHRRRHQQPDTEAPLASQFNSIGTLLALLCRRWHGLERQRVTVVAAVGELMQRDPAQLVDAAVECHLRDHTTATTAAAAATVATNADDDECFSAGGAKSQQQQRRRLCPVCCANQPLGVYERQLFSIQAGRPGVGIDERSATSAYSDAALDADEMSRSLLTDTSSSSSALSVHVHGQLSRGSWRDNELGHVLRQLAALAKQLPVSVAAAAAAARHIKRLQLMQREFRLLRALWARVSDRVAACDELSMATIRLRLRYPHEPPPTLPHSSLSASSKTAPSSSGSSAALVTGYVLEPYQLEPQRVALLAERQTADAECKRRLGQRLYLCHLQRHGPHQHRLQQQKQQQQKETNSQQELRQESVEEQQLAAADGERASGGASVGACDQSEQFTCPICERPLGASWCVLQCGHSFSADCVQTLFEEYASVVGRRRRIRCAVCRDWCAESDVAFVSASNNNNSGSSGSCGQQSEQMVDEENDGGGGGVEWSDERAEVVGGHSSKVTAVVRRVLGIRARDYGAKILVFATWLDVLDAAAAALQQNGVRSLCLHAPRHFGRCLRQFRTDASVHVLLLSIGAGARGLNLIEANHVVLMNPVLDPAAERQALGRIHRIGQTKSTWVHRLLVRDSIEERIHVFNATRMHSGAASGGGGSVAGKGHGTSVTALEGQAQLTMADLRSLFTNE